MSLIPIIKGDKINFTNPANGSIPMSATLPQGTYGSPIVSGEQASISVTDQYGSTKIYTYSMRAGAVGTIINVMSV